LQWREANEIDKILTWEPPSIFPEELPFQISGFDKEDSPGGIQKSKFSFFMPL